ncbi:hypothetical protein VSN93_16785 [Acinetobacter johnsonii]|uniref:phage baseplate plug family protein n=1 Tax=Acinetobacter johnsonii TaxID=40214 RepID=UPI00216742B4|nr:hypothetical protein [Acinetobacter johnsonii]MCS3526747.1 hypothetical protein [Acinetobacter johnsonii]
MALFEIPLLNTNQKFNITLDGTNYKLKITFRGSKWFLDLMDTAENYLIAGVPMVMGDNLFAQHQHIIKGGLYVSNSNEDETQTFNDLGNKIKLYWSDD